MASITILTTPIILSGMGLNQFSNIQLTEEVTTWFVDLKFPTKNTKYESPYEIKWIDAKKIIVENCKTIDVQKLEFLEKKIEDECFGSIFISSIFAKHSD